jgi:uncharacterized repeat protein (TIGR04138 family)
MSVTPRDDSFWDVVDGIRARDPRYRREAYGFVMIALGVTVQQLPPERRADPERRHLSGQELLRGIVAVARREFGMMAETVFGEWGLRSAADLGEVVFQLVEHGQLHARPEDRREDFLGGPELARLLTEGLDLGVPRAPR